MVFISLLLIFILLVSDQMFIILKIRLRIICIYNLMLILLITLYYVFHYKDFCIFIIIDFIFTNFHYIQIDLSINLI